MHRLSSVIRACLALLIAASASAALAQSYPSRLVRMVIPYGPGGPTDIVGRMLVQKMTESLGQQVIVENRLGAGGAVGTESVARSAPDGYTLMFSASGAMVITPHLNFKLPYEPFRDFAPIALGATAPTVLIVGPNSSIHSVKDLIAQAKAQPGKLNYSTAGVGTPPHLAAELLKSATGIDVQHVPYKGGPQADAAAISGEVAFIFTQPSIVNLARAGKARILGVSSAKRSALMPEVPTIAEGGVPGFEVIAWYGLLAPAKTPDDIIARLNKDMMAALGQKDVVDRLKGLGFEPPAPHTPADFLAYMRSESAKWQNVVKSAGIKVD